MINCMHQSKNKFQNSHIQTKLQNQIQSSNILKSKMQTPTNRKKTLKIQQENNPSQDRLNSFNQTSLQNKFFMSNQKKNQHIKNLSNNQIINIPQPKRAQKDQSISANNQKDLLVGKKIVSKIVHGLEDNQKTSKINNKQKVIKGQNINQFSNKLQSSFYVNLHSKRDNIGVILSYFLNENDSQKNNQLQQPMKTVQQWENEEINKFVEDPNLGDYLIKMPNPDHIQEKYIKRYKKLENNRQSSKNKNEKSGPQQYRIEYEQALLCYNEMFNTEGLQKSRRQRQLTSFIFAYYLLSSQKILESSKMFILENYDFYLKQSNQQLELGYEINQNKNQKETSKGSVNDYFLTVDRQIQIFCLIFQYFRKIQFLGIEELSLIKKSMQVDLQKALKIYKKLIEEQIVESNKISFLSIKYVGLIEHQLYKRSLTTEQQLNKHKKLIYQKFLIPIVLSLFQTLAREPLGYDFQMQQAKSKYFFFLLAKNLKQIYLLFYYFPSFTNKLFLNYVIREFCKYGSKRMVTNGQFLQKKLSGENLLWVNSKEKPRDLYTLLRNCLNYQLTQRCLFRTRTFLSKNQKELIIVVKASEQVLEYYAQKNEIPMEIQIGATDIFSFQPVDSYNRPLRLHSYLRDQQFIRKYSLKSNKIDKDEENESKSMQSQALNIYKKAQKMNPDELRAKTILDQEDSDEAFRWISSRLNCSYINEANILVNEKNNEEIDRQTWQCYYVYNKLVISFVNRIRKMLQGKSQSTENDIFVQEVNNNLGLILRLMFIKAIAMVNDFHYQNRQNRSILPNKVQNIYKSKRKLKNIWDRLKIRQPTGYSQYIKNKFFQKIWRKYEVNQNKLRSKFFPAQRINIANKIINRYININRAIEKNLIIAYFPIHDPFILKGIKIEPYLLSLKRKAIKNTEKQQKPDSVQNRVFNIYSLYQSKYTASDFTKQSIQQKLSVKNSIFKHFSVETVRFYCGQKIGFYFQFTKYLTKQSFWFIFPTFIIQIFLWVEQTLILSKGSTRLEYFNDALIFILTIMNMFWTTNTVQEWKVQEKNLAERFGVANMSEQDQKRVTFVGSYKRNFETDDMNYEYVSSWVTWIKIGFGLLVNLMFVILVALVIIQIFVLKSVLFQQGYSQSTVNAVPSILIAIAVQVFNYLYIFLIKLITSFQNHKTISSFENSLISKSYTITFVVTFFSIFIYAFFSQYLDADYLCIIKTTQTKEMYIFQQDQRIYHCSYFVSSQLLSFVMIDLGLTLISGIWPYMKFKIRQFLQSRKKKSRTKFYYNKFQAIDQFYEQQVFLRLLILGKVLTDSDRIRWSR